VVKNLEGIHMASGNLQEVEGSDDVREDEAVGPLDRPVYMGFGGEVADGVHGVGFVDLRHPGQIAHVSPLEDITAGVRLGDTRQVLRVPRVGEGIHIDNPSPEIGPFQKITDKIAPNEAAAAGYQQGVDRHRLIAPVSLYQKKVGLGPPELLNSFAAVYQPTPIS
jgi:hypothetical protein